MKILIAFLLLAAPALATDLLAPRLPGGSRIDDPVGAPVQYDPKTISGIILTAATDGMLIISNSSFTVKDGSGRTIRKDDVIFLRCDNPPKVPSDSVVSAKINPAGELFDYETVSGSVRTIYQFQVIGQIKELR